MASLATGAPNAFADLFALPGVDAPAEYPGERVRLLQRSAVTGTEWILASGANRLWRVYHEDYELCVLPPEANARDGGASYAYRRWYVPCRPGAVYFLEPDTLHVNRRLYGPADYYVIKVPRETVAGLARELGLGDVPHFRRAFTESERLMQAIRVLAGAVTEGEDPLRQETYLLEGLRVALEESGEERIQDQRQPARRDLARARDLIHSKATAPVSLAELQKVTGLSKFHLVRSFARAYGLPPHAYQTQLRVAEARRQLAAGTPPAAVDAGFFDQSHLARHFKRAYAVTPAAYQRAILS